MKDNHLLPVSIERYKMLYPECSCIDNDLVLMDFQSFKLPAETRQMQCVFIGLCASGSGKYTIGTIEHSFSANDVIIIGDGQILGDITTTNDFNGEAMLISRRYLDEVIADVRNISNLFIYALENPVTHISTAETMMFKEYYSLMKMKVDNTGHFYRREIVGTILATIIYEMGNSICATMNLKRKCGIKSERIFNEFIDLVEKNFRETRRVSWYSDKLGISAKSLLEMVKRISDRTPNDWLDIYTTMEIRHLLRHTSKSIKEIAEELHFGTQGSLGKFFKEHVGISPKNYRTN